MIKTIGTVPASSEYEPGTMEGFIQWFEPQSRYQLDVETNMTEYVKERKLSTIQFGEYAPDSEDKVQWVIIWTQLTQQEKVLIFKALSDKTKKKYIHNTVFEYNVFLNYNLVIDNVYDTMLVEKVLYTGYNNYNDEEGNRFFSLAGMLLRRLGLSMDKELQTGFDTDVELTEAHVLYAAQDVQFLDIAAEQQLEGITAHGLQNIVDLENEAILALAEIEYNGMHMDQPAWLANLEIVQPIIDKYTSELEGYLISDPKLNKRAYELGILSDQDKVLINWNSHIQKKLLFSIVFPELQAGTKAVLRKALNTPGLSLEEVEILYPIVHEGDYSKLLDRLVAKHYEHLVELGYLIPAGTIMINWNSDKQVLPLLTAIHPKLNALNEQALSAVAHPIVAAFQEYNGAMKLRSSFGVRFLELHIEPDGNVRTRFNPVLETGRISSASPNMQQIPANDDVGNRYRNCFVPDSEDEVFVDSDYSSQELCVIASLSGDPVWLSALERGEDLHSVCADLVYGKEWKEAAQPDCAYYFAYTDKDMHIAYPANSKHKCSCKKHKKLRTAVKTINFGLAYGMSQFKLSSTLSISVKEAELLIEKYFKTFPKIGKRLEQLGEFGVRNGFIMTLAPFYRKRWFPDWERLKTEVEYHIQGIQHNKTLGGIERQAKNTPIQGGSADMMKLALVYTRRYINAHKLRTKVKLSMQVHDQLTTSCKKEFAEEWKIKLTELMEEAAKVIIPSGLLKADTNISSRWAK